MNMKNIYIVDINFIGVYVLSMSIRYLILTLLVFRCLLSQEHKDISVYSWEFKGNNYVAMNSKELNDKYRTLLSMGYNPLPFNEFLSSLCNSVGKRQTKWTYKNKNYFARSFRRQELNKIFLTLSPVILCFI